MFPIEFNLNFVIKSCLYNRLLVMIFLYNLLQCTKLIRKARKKDLFPQARYGFIYKDISQLILDLFL